MRAKQVFSRLEQSIEAPWRRIEKPWLKRFSDTFDDWLLAQEKVVRSDDLELTICFFLLDQIARIGEEVDALNRLHGEHSRRYAQANSPDEREHAIFSYASALGANRRSLREDRRALERWLDFGAIADRGRIRLARAERRITLALRCLGQIAHSALASATTRQGPPSAWTKLALEERLGPLLVFAGNPKVRFCALACLRSALAAYPPAAHESLISESTTLLVYRLAQDSRQDVWLQCEAMSLLLALSRHSFRSVFETRFANAGAGDDLFFRRHALNLVAGKLAETPEFADLIGPACHDPSAYVRQAAAAALARSPRPERDEQLWHMIRNDAVPQVRAAALLQLPLLLAAAGTDHTGQFAAGLAGSLLRETSPFVQRVTLHVAVLVAESLSADDPRCVRWVEGVVPAIEALHVSAADLRVRRWAAACRETLWLLGSELRRRQAAALRECLDHCPPGESCRLPADGLPADEAQAGRLLATITQQDFGVELTRRRSGWRLFRGHRFGFRSWRWLHEMRHPSPDKRQAFRHTTGRIFHSRSYAPSAILAELAATKVPGEPLHYADEAGWRPYLPLVDELISALDQNLPVRAIRRYTAEGITEIEPPQGTLARLRARLILTWRFADYARLRNWQADSQSDAGSYLRAVAGLGFTVRLRAHTADSPQGPGAGTSLDPAALRFFPAAGLFGAEAWWPRFEHYFVSAYENTIFELSLFVLGCGTFFLGRHVFLNQAMRRARSAIPLVIGGWGTRGKSGTERIKAGLFNALGYSVVSKTTGCEAMFLHAHPFDDLREMFLFRPYDKATIWEQFDVVRISRRLGCEVFLWECMALTPAFVRILQRQWMRDDLSTLTNTFPDHEDIQGPAGINIPEVMTNFIPKERTLVTSEEQMLPILRHAAGDLQTRLRAVGWLQSGLLAPDVLARFPYQEHPDNIALVVALADELGIGEEFALKEMADRVVPDLGVLKTYPMADVDGRRLSFVNGMSANERFGCLGNWTRVGFDRVTPDTHPGVIISTVVNNRADRIARSRVFAGILVEDITADRHFLIGSNLQGLQGYIRESWQAWVGGITLFPESGGSPHEILVRYASHFRIPYSADRIQARLAAMLKGQQLADAEQLGAHWQSADELGKALAARDEINAQATVEQLRSDLAAFEAFQSFARRVEGVSGKDKQLDAAFRTMLHDWFFSKFVVIENFHASGDSIIATIAASTPPGFENRIMGIQNIKGTGLDFVYRWQAWDTCARACDKILNPDARVAEKGLADLFKFDEFGLLCEARVRETLQAAKRRIEFQQERFQAEISVIATRLEKALGDIRSSFSVEESVGWLERVCNAIEGFMDAGDAVKRRTKANRIYEDLISQRISHTRAALELQALNKRQKGGWLYAFVRQRWHSLFAGTAGKSPFS